MMLLDNTGQAKITEVRIALGLDQISRNLVYIGGSRSTIEVQGLLIYYGWPTIRKERWLRKGLKLCNLVSRRNFTFYHLFTRSSTLELHWTDHYEPTMLTSVYMAPGVWHYWIIGPHLFMVSFIGSLFSYDQG